MCFNTRTLLVLVGGYLGALALTDVHVRTKIGKATFAEITTPFAQRVRQIELTLELWRWLPGLGRPAIVVNIPQFRLFALHTAEDSESDMLQMDVIVGQPFTRMRTPIFAADLTYVLFRP